MTDMARQDADFDWFIANYNDLYKQYGAKYLVIKNKTVLGAYDNVRQALDSTDEPVGSYIVQYCNGEESGYTAYIASTNFMGYVG